MFNYTNCFGKAGKLQNITKYIALLLLLCFQMISTNELSAQWRWQNPTPQGNSLQGVSLINSSTGISVGSSGVTIKTTDGGNTWSNNYHGTDLNFSWGEMSAIDANTAIALGGQFISTGIYKTTDDGSSWTNLFNSATISFSSIDFINASTGIVVGSDGTIMKTTNAGDNWTTQSSGVVNFLNGVNFIDANIGTVVGADGLILRTTNGGDNWFTQTSGTAFALNGVFFLDANIGTTVGVDGTILRTTNAGNTWTPQTSPSSGILEGVYLNSLSNGTIVGSGIIMSTTDAGNSWVNSTDITGKTFNSVVFADVNTGMAVGLNGTIAKTTNAGVNWLLNSNGATTDLRSIHFSNRNFGTAVGGSGGIVRTTNGGQSWISQLSVNNNTLLGVFFSGNNIGTAVGAGGLIIKTTNGGNDWFAQTSGVAPILNDVFFIDVNTGTVVGNSGTIVKTTNGGDNWFTQTSGLTQNINDVFFIDVNTGFGVGASGRIIKTTNGGTNWVSQTLGAQALNSVCFSDGVNGTAVGASGRMLRTTNAGVNWVVQTSGTTAALNSVYFINANTGTAVGATGTIIRTTNGGANWTSEQAGTGVVFMDVFYMDAGNITIAGASGTILRIQTPESNPNFGNNNQTGNDLYYFANSLPGSGSPSQPQFTWRDTTGSISLYADGSNQAPGIFSGSNDDGRWDLLNQLAGGNIRFFGTDYTNIYIGTNGIVGFNSFNTSVNQPPFNGLNQSEITEAIFPLWTNMNIDYTGVSGRRVSYKVTSDELIVTYNRIPVYSASNENNPDRYASFQVLIRFNNGAPTQNSTLFMSYNYDETGSVFINEYNAGTLRNHLVGIQKNNELQQYFQYRFKNILTLTTDGPLFGSNLTIATGPNDNALPVELSSFAASVNNRDVQLNWTTVSEENNAGYDIERAIINPSGNISSEWSKIAFMEGNGTTNESKNYSFIDRGLNTGKYNYRLKQIDYNGNYRYYNLSNEIIIGVPGKYSLSQNYPNPFNPVTKINFDLPVESRVTIKIFDITGREVATLINGLQTAGYHTITFNAGNIASGIYFYKITAGDGTETQFAMTKKMMIVK